MEKKQYNKVEVLIVGAGPAGLSCAIALKKKSPHLDIAVIDKAPRPGNHNLSGAAVDAQYLDKILSLAFDDYKQNPAAKDLLTSPVKKDLTYMMFSPKHKIRIDIFIKIAGLLKLGIGQMQHKNNYILSISQLTKTLCQAAKDLGVDVMHGFSAEKILLNDLGIATAVELKELGLDKNGNPQPNHIEKELIQADAIVIAEGCDGYICNQYIEDAGLKTRSNQLYSLGVKQIFKVSQQQYELFGPNTCCHVLGYPLWKPILGPAIFGGGFLYAMGNNQIAVGIIAGTDWKYRDFNPQDALKLFIDTPFLQQYLKDAQIIEAGAKMIPEGGYYTVPMQKGTGYIGRNNVVIIGDSASFVDMYKIQGLHLAIESGILAAQAISQKIISKQDIAAAYTGLVKTGIIWAQLRKARNFRQTVAKLGLLFGMPLSVISHLLPKWKIKPDYKTMAEKKYPYKGNKEYDKDTFTALAGTEHREDQPCHLKILDPAICKDKCAEKFDCPCIRFCPAGVYEAVNTVTAAANPSNCLHCKTCQRKCPFDNIRWTVPEGNGGPRHKLA